MISMTRAKVEANDELELDLRLLFFLLLWYLTKVYCFVSKNTEGQDALVPGYDPSE